MGTYYTNGASKKDIIEEVTRDGAYTNHVVIDKSLVGNNLWIVIGKREDPTKDRALLLYLLRGHRDGWGYTPIDESMGPCETNCPLKYLDMVPDPGSYATGWRARVREDHKLSAAKRKQRNSLTVGATIEAKVGVSILGSPIARFRIESLKPLRATALAADGSYITSNVRVSPKHFGAEVK